MSILSNLSNIEVAHLVSCVWSDF